jgi:hypothetical protein
MCRSPSLAPQPKILGALVAAGTLAALRSPVAFAHGLGLLNNPCMMMRGRKQNESRTGTENT